jgi:hypothetical protein
MELLKVTDAETPLFRMTFLRFSNLEKGPSGLRGIHFEEDRKRRFAIQPFFG